MPAVGNVEKTFVFIGTAKSLIDKREDRDRGTYLFKKSGISETEPIEIRTGRTRIPKPPAQSDVEKRHQKRDDGRRYITHVGIRGSTGYCHRGAESKRAASRFADTIIDRSAIAADSP